MVGAISQKKVIAMNPIGKSMNGEDFLKFVQEELAPKLWKGAVVVMDNLRVHKVEGVEEMIEAVGARVVYLSPYSPEFNLRRTFMVGTKGIAQDTALCLTIRYNSRGGKKEKNETLLPRYASKDC